MHEVYYRAHFDYSKPIPKLFRKIIEREFMELRNLVVDDLNPNFERWNAEFGDSVPSDDDPLKDYGGTEYCKFITHKMAIVIRHFNQMHEGKFIRLDVDEIGDIIGRTLDRNVKVTLSLKPVDL